MLGRVLSRHFAFKLGPLPFAYDALEPHVDKRTLEIHHDKHHQTYVDKLNAALTPQTADQKLEQLIIDAKKHPLAIRNMGGGHYNHALFWQCLSPQPKKPFGELLKKIEAKWGSFDKFKTDFSNQATGFFGSGWTWLAVKGSDLVVVSTPNQDNPMMQGIVAEPAIPIMVIDLWEHAYYLKYQNRRPEFIGAFWNVLDWGKVDDFYQKYAKLGKPVPESEIN